VTAATTPRRPTSRRRAGTIGLTAAGVVALAAAVAVAVGSHGSGPAGLTHPAPVDVGLVPSAAPRMTPAGTPAADRPVEVHPDHITIPAIGVDTTVVPVGLDAADALGVPADPAAVGWWAAGPVPGAAAGTAVLDSHVNYAGQPGAFADLGRLRPGATITLTGAGRVQRFVVTGLREYPKASLPWSTVFASSVEGRLALVTCGGPFDPATGHYLDNILAFAIPAPSTR
jgi:hypothetical protein